MANYSISLIPIDRLTTQTNGVPGTPWNPQYHDPSGGEWNYAPWTVSYDINDVVTIDIQDNDDDPEHLNDDSWWQQGRGTQTIQTDIGYASAGDDITDEYELTFTATVDGVEETYTLAAIAVIKPGDPGLTPSSYIGFTFDGQWPPAGTVLTYVPNSNVDNATLNAAAQQVPCFTRGTLIATVRGEVAIEDLHEGDLVLTKDHGPQPLRWIGSKVLDRHQLSKNEKIRPIRIQAGALGISLPAADLVVSPQHRILIRSRIAERMFGQAEVLVAAKQLLQVEGVDIAADMASVEYFHILFDRHEVVISNGAETESLFTGPEALNALSPEAVEEIFTLFPELRDRRCAPSPARGLISGRQARQLALRHIQNNRHLIAA